MDQIGWQIVNLKNVRTDNKTKKNVTERMANEKINILIRTMTVIWGTLSVLSLRVMKGFCLK